MVQRAEFEQALGTRPRARSAHFAIHHVPERDWAAAQAAERRRQSQLSTGLCTELPDTVDNSTGSVRLGCLVPKRHARRAVTRSLFKRLMRGAVQSQRQALAPGLWLLRLHAPWPVQTFPSASSQALRRQARAELDTLLARLARRPAVAGASA